MSERSVVCVHLFIASCSFRVSIGITNGSLKFGRESKISQVASGGLS